MVKIPSLDDLKKAGANLVDSAKSGKLMDDIKLRIENVGERLVREGAEMPKSETPIKEQFQVLQTTVRELYQLQAQHAEVMKKFEAQLSVLAKLVETAGVMDKALTSAQSVTVVAATTTTEEKKEP